MLTTTSRPRETLVADALLAVAEAPSGAEVGAVQDIKDLFRRPLISRKLPPLPALPPDPGLALALDQGQGVAGPAGIVHQGNI